MFIYDFIVYPLCRWIVDRRHQHLSQKIDGLSNTTCTQKIGVKWRQFHVSFFNCARRRPPVVYFIFAFFCYNKIVGRESRFGVEGNAKELITAKVHFLFVPSSID